MSTKRKQTYSGPYVENVDDVRELLRNGVSTQRIYTYFIQTMKRDHFTLGEAATIWKTTIAPLLRDPDN